MLFGSAHVRVTAEYGTATLWLDFPGEPVNGLDLSRLREIDAALAAVEANPCIDILIVRSAKPGGFCAGLRPEALASLTTAADRAAFAWLAQQVAARLARLDAVTVAFLDGPCLGAGLELALASDYRLCVARPTTLLGFPDAPAGVLPCLGGTARLREFVGRRTGELLGSGRLLSGRQARDLGLVDHAFCERRAKIELRAFLDHFEVRPRKPRREPEPVGLAGERAAFAAGLGSASARAAIRRQLAALRSEDLDPPLNPVPPFPAAVGLVGEDAATSRLVAGAVVRGGLAVIRGSAQGVFAGIRDCLTLGFLTPLEAEQARGRVRVSDESGGFDRAGLVFVSGDVDWDALASRVPPRCVVAVLEGGPPDEFPHPRRVIGLQLEDGKAVLLPGPDTDADTVAALAAWLRPFGFAVAVHAPEPTTGLQSVAA